MPWLLRPLPFENPDRIVRLNVRNVDNAQNRVSDLSYPDFQDWQTATRTFEQMAAVAERAVDISAIERSGNGRSRDLRLVEHVLAARATTGTGARLH